MVLSGVSNGTFATGYRLQLEWSGAQDILGNYTDISWATYLISLGSSWTISSSTGKSLSTVIDGQTFGSSVNVSLSGNQKKLLASGTKRVFHNADGSRAFNTSVSLAINVTISGTYYGTVSIGTNSYTLPSIPRESTATATNADIESATSININKYLSTYTTTLRYEFPSGEVGALIGTIVNKTTLSSYGWTVPSSFYAKIPNAISGVCKIYVDTYNGSTLIGTKSTTFTATVGVANKPDVSATISDSNSLTSALTGDNQKFVKFISNAAFSITSTPKNSATIVSRSIVCGAKSSTSASGTLTEIETATFTVTTTDSRGLSNSVTYNRTLVNYVKLTNNPTISRTTPTGDTISYLITGNYFNGSFGSASNTLNLDYRVSGDNGATWLDGGWQALTSISISGNTYSKSGVLSRTGGYDYTKQALVQIRAYDKIYTVSSPISKSIPLAKGIPVYNYGANFFKVNTNMYLGSSKIIESGSNANGNWVRYADGTQICWHFQSVVQAITTSALGWYIGALLSLTFPISFIAEPTVNLTPKAGGTGNIAMGLANATASTSFTYYLLRGASTASAEYIAKYTAIGRWK